MALGRGTREGFQDNSAAPLNLAEWKWNCLACCARTKALTPIDRSPWVHCQPRHNTPQSCFSHHPLNPDTIQAGFCDHKCECSALVTACVREPFQVPRQTQPSLL